jgi:hypothetical protein
MLLDKGSDEVFGFKPDKTSGASPLQKFLKNKKISKIAECWEMENNNRTYCSFRDPDKRKDLTFDAFEMRNGQKIRKLNSVQSAPIVTDSFEYRYHPDADILDYIYDPIKEGDKYNSDDTQSYMNSANVDLRFDKDDVLLNQNERAEFILNRYENWEKACQWVWSTCTDYVISQGNYEKTTVGDTLWEPNYFYLLVDNNYVLDTNSTWDSKLTYYRRGDFDNVINDYIYADAHAVDEAHLFSRNKNNFYININENNINKTPEYVSCASDPEFNDSMIYYELVNYNDN